MSAGEQRHRERLVRAEMFRLIEAERIGWRHSLADALRRVAQRIDPVVIEQTFARGGPDGPRPAN